jgi:hypothetical protein
MTPHTRTHAALAAMTMVIMCSGAAAQELRAPTGQGKLEVPIAVRIQHNQIRDDLALARQDGGAVGDAARILERVWGPHLTHAEAAVLPPLGVLRALTRNETIPDARQAIAMSTQLEHDLPALLEEHRTLYDATKRFMDAASREHKPTYEELARRLWLQLRLEEDVLYPTVLLVGQQLKARDSAKPRPTNREHR